jgi:hypothetical protein
MKVADIELFWTKSAGPDIKSQKVRVVVDGGTLSIPALPPEVENFHVTAKAFASVQFSVTAVNADGLEGTATTFSFTLDSLEAPPPPTDLGFRITAVRDVDDEPAPPAATA